MSILHRLWPRRRATGRITMGVHVVAVPKPIPLSERKPGPSDCWNAACWFAKWDGCVWVWRWNWYATPGRETHWLPATTEVLPARCCPPEVERVDFAAVKQRIEAAQCKPAHVPLNASMLDELVRQMDASQPEVG